MDISKGEVAAVSEVAAKTGRRQHGQFNHIQTFARKVSKLSGKTKKGEQPEKRARQWTVADIAGEADREEEHSRHVIEPLKPVLIAGMPVSELGDYVEEVMSTAKQADGKRAVRSDVHVLLGAVYSLPYRPDDYFEHKEQCDQFIADAMKFHESAYGKVVSTVMHLDESMVHWHVYTVDPDARNLVPGWRAKKEEMARQEAAGASKKEAIRAGNIAYKMAMKELQDRFFVEVGERNGLARYGDRRMRYQPGEARVKRLEREGHARMMREREAQAEATRKKIEADRLEQERINAEAAAQLAELIQEKKRIEHRAEYVQRQKERVERRVESLTSTPQFLLEQELKTEKKELASARQRIAELEETVVEKDRYIDKLLATIRELKAELKSVAQKLLNKFR